jgi:hypothetical protein
MAYNLATAAMATGVNKSTILRAVKAGRISGTKDETGWHIEVAELHRVFKPLPSAATDEPPAVPRDATVHELLALLRQQVEDMRRQVEDARQERDRWHAAFEANQRLLPPPATDNAAVSNRESDHDNRAETAAAEPESPRRSLGRRAWDWLKRN